MNARTVGLGMGIALLAFGVGLLFVPSPQVMLGFLTYSLALSGVVLLTAGWLLYGYFHAAGQTQENQRVVVEVSSTLEQPQPRATHFTHR